MATTATHLLVIRGDTRPAREALKKVGWRWNPDAQHWYVRLVSAHADRVRSGDVAFVRDSLKAHRKGCQVTLDGIVIWTSKTFGDAHEAPIPGDAYNCDTYGNPIVSRRIPGSAPDDRI